MAELAYQLLVGLAKSTLFLASAAIVLTLVLRLGRVRSPSLHRLAWALAILLGWVFWSIPVAVPWYEADPVQQATAPAVPDTGYRPLDPGLVASPAAPPAGGQLIKPPNISQVSPTPQSDASLMRTVWSYWPIAVAASWLAGLLGCAAYLVWCYGRLIRLLPQSGTCEPGWQHEWQEVLDRAGVSASIPLWTSEEFGPALCRLPRGYLLVVPTNLWHGLAREQRLAILMHELAHYQRGDVWKSLALRLLALPHWFNPFSWYAVRRFEEGGEWACDEAVRRSHPDHVTGYAKALLKLGEMAHAGRLLSTAAQGGGLGVRVRRLLANKPLEDSRMKKLLVGSVALVLVLACVVRFELVAQERDSGLEDAPAGTQVNLTTAKEMLEAAEETYKAMEAEYAVGAILMDFMYPWSRRWLDAQLLVIEAERSGNPEEIAQARAKAFREHLGRMEKLHAQVTELYKVGAIGGEPGRYHATRYYLAEAKLWLQRAIGSQNEIESLENESGGDRQEPISQNDRSGTSRNGS